MTSNEGKYINIRDIVQNVWNVRPIVQCITNFVTVNDCANIVLAIGGSPTMAHDVRETADIASGCQALVLNMGNVTDTEAMIKAGQKSNQIGNPVIMDPVGVGGSQLRRDIFRKMSKNIHFSVIRGNASEIKYIGTGINNKAGVDAAQEDEINADNIDKFVSLAKNVAAAYQCVVCISGKIDVIADKSSAFICKNGDAIMSRITGSGCMSSALLGAICGGNKTEILESALAAVVIMNTSGEIALEKTKACDGGTMTFRNYLIDTVSKLQDKSLIENIIERAVYEKM